MIKIKRPSKLSGIRINVTASFSTFEYPRFRSRVSLFPFHFTRVQTPTPRVLYHEPRCTSKDRVSWKIAGPFVKCKIRNTSPQKWNKPRHTGWYHRRRSTGGSNRNSGVDRRWCGGGGLRVGGVRRLGYVSHLSAQILLWLYAAGARNFTYVRTFVPSRYNIRT